MKKRLLAILLLICTLTMTLASCSKPIYNYEKYTDFISLGKLEGIEINQSDIDHGIIEKYQSSVTSSDQKTNTYSVADPSILIQDFDTVTIDFVGKIDGKEFTGGTASNQSLTIGSNSYIDGFEDGLIGYSIGDSVVLNLKFPQDYGNPELNGKDVEFTVKVKSIKRITYPEYNDANVKKYVKTYETVAAFEEATKETVIKNLLWNELYKASKVKSYPKDELTMYYNQSIDSYTASAASLGLTLESMIKSFYGMELKAFYQNLASQAKSQVKQELIILAAIETYEKLVLSDEAYEKEVKKLYDEAVEAETYTDSYEKFVKDSDETAVKISVYYDVLIKYVQENSKIIDDVTKNGFVTNRNGTRYYIDGELQKGWVTIDGALYFFDTETGYAPGECALVTPKDSIEAKYLKFDKNGKYLEIFDGIYTDATGTRYFVEGVLQTGVKEGFALDGKEENKATYFFDARNKGYMATGIVDVDGVYYDFGKDGKRVGIVTGLKADSTGTRYFTNEGKLVTGLVTLNLDEKGDKEYYFDPDNNGYMVEDDAALITDVNSGTSTYYVFDKNGVKGDVANGLVDGKSGLRYFENGELKTGEISVTVDEKTNTYYFEENTGVALKEAWSMKVEGDKKEIVHYFKKDGTMAKGEELTIDSVKYSFDENGDYKIIK